MRKIIKKSAACLVAGMIMITSAAFPTAAEGSVSDVTEYSASSNYTDIVLNGNVIGQQKSNGTIMYVNQNDAALNGRALVYLLDGDEKKKIVLPSETIKIDRSLTLHNNTTITATGATIYQTDNQKQIINNDCTAVNYGSLKNVTITGGTWKIKDNEKQLRATSTIRFNHASNIKLKNCTVYTNNKSHAVELIACKNVTIDGCKLLAKGSAISDSMEEALQIDIATKATAPTVASFGDEYVKGQTCCNITVKNCTIKGSRGIACNKTDTEDGKYLGKLHKNITITGCKITGTASGAVALYNTVGFKVKNNTIISKGSRTDTVYTIGLNIALFKNNKSASKYKNTVSGNTIKGGRQGLYIISYCNSQYGKTTVKNNKIYCKKGTSNAKVIKNCTAVSDSGNKLYTWK